MWPNPQETADLVIFIEEILNDKLHFLYSMRNLKPIPAYIPFRNAVHKPM